MGKRTRMPRDQFLRRYFDHPRSVESLVRAHVPESILAGMDFGTLERQPAEFVTDGLKSRAGDCVWRLRHAGGDGKETWCYLYVLVEFQSRPDWRMALRVLLYMILLWLDLIARKEIGRKDLLPPILPIVYYDGRRKWKGPLLLEDMLHPLAREMRRLFGGFFLTDARRLPLEALAGPGDPLFHLILSERADRLRDRLEAFLDAVERMDGGCEHQKETLEAWLKMHPGLPEAFLEIMEKEEDVVTRRERMRAELEEFKEELRAEGRAEGEAKGRAEGEAKGRAEGEAKGRAEGEAKGRAEGEAKGRAEGEDVGGLKKALEIARRMLLAGMDPARVAEMADLSAEDVARLALETR